MWLDLLSGYYLGYNCKYLLQIFRMAPGTKPLLSATMLLGATCREEQCIRLDQAVALAPMEQLVMELILLCVLDVNQIMDGHLNN